MWRRAHRTRHRRATVLTLVLTIALVGCPGDTVQPAFVEMVEVSPGSLTLDVGQTGALTATALDADGNVVDCAVTWSTSDAAVATVDRDGRVEAVGAGTAMVTASCEGVTGSAGIEVSDPVVAVDVSPADTSLLAGDTARLTATAVGASGDTLDRPVTWSSADPGVASVDDQGWVVAVGTGSTRVAATVEDRSDTADVDVYDVLAVTTDGLRAGTVETAYADTLEAVGGDGAYTWSVVAGSLPAGLSLAASSGVISGTPTAADTTAVTVQVESGDGQTATAQLSIMVTDPVVEVDVSPSEASLTPGDTIGLTATSIGASGDTLQDRPVEWTTSDAGVASVDEAGAVTAIAEGSAVVTATVEGHSDSASINVYRALEVATAALQSGTVDEPYADTLAAEGGDGEFTWSVVSDSLPAGLSLAASSGVISGTPAAAGSATFTVQVQSGDGQTATAELAITVSLGLDRAYVTAYYELDVIDLAGDTVVSELDVKHGNAIAIAPAGDRAYVASCMDDTISVLDLATNTVATTIPLAACYDLAFTPGGGRAFAVGAGVYAIDPASTTVTGTIPSGTGPTGIAITPDGSQALVVNNGSDNVTVVDLGPDTVVATIGVGSLPWYAVVSPDGTRAYVTNNSSGTVSVIDLTTGTVTATIDLPGVNLAYTNPGPIHIAIAPDGGTVYVANVMDPSVSVIDTESNTVTTTIGLWYAPDELAVTPAGDRIYVASRGTWEGDDYDVLVIDAAANSVTTEIYIGWQPAAIAITPDD